MFILSRFNVDKNKITQALKRDIFIFHTGMDIYKENLQQLFTNLDQFHPFVYQYQLNSWEDTHSQYFGLFVLMLHIAKTL